MSCCPHKVALAEPREGASPRPQGFTLLELVVAMGLLSAFLAMLVQVLDTEGEPLAGIHDEQGRGVIHAVVRFWIVHG